MNTHRGLAPIAVEVVLTPGLSQIQVLGLADKVIQESSKRIFTAIQKQGFRIPPGQQAIVNLSPNHLRKSSQGLDLAVALGILVESQQISRDLFAKSSIAVYGELSLTGEVRSPKDIGLLDFENNVPAVFTGVSDDQHSFDRYEVQQLNEISSATLRSAQTLGVPLRRPLFANHLRFSPSMARLMTILAVGELSLIHI